MNLCQCFTAIVEVMFAAFTIKHGLLFTGPGNITTMDALMGCVSCRHTCLGTIVRHEVFDAGAEYQIL